MMQELANHFIAWANENAHPLKSFETADFNDLAFLAGPAWLLWEKASTIQKNLMPLHPVFLNF